MACLCRGVTLALNMPVQGVEGTPSARIFSPPQPSRGYPHNCLLYMHTCNAIYRFFPRHTPPPKSSVLILAFYPAAPLALDPAWSGKDAHPATNLFVQRSQTPHRNKSYSELQTESGLFRSQWPRGCKNPSRPLCHRGSRRYLAPSSTAPCRAPHPDAPSTTIGDTDLPIRPPILNMPLPLPASQRSRHTYLPRSLTSLLFLALCLSFTVTLAARPPSIPDTLVPPADLGASIAAELAELEAKGIVLLETRPPPKVASSWDLSSYSGELQKRGHADLVPRAEGDEEDEESSTTAAPSKTSPQSSSTSSSTSFVSVAVAVPTDTNAPLPQPFDNKIGPGFVSEACPQFIKGFLAAPEFQACYPISLLLETSQTFFQTLRSPFLTTKLLDHSCTAPTTCGPYLSSLAATLNSTCTPELANARTYPIATMALNGLLAYPSLRTATCLKSATGSYCFADAMTNSTGDEDGFVYYLGVGHALPNKTQMTCNECLKDVVGVFGAAAANRTVPVAGV
ncbi:hypothetical protein V493_06165, partial [Pseudogymnoascus sp. VKM F-4281 (FW-2241)]